MKANFNLSRLKNLYQLSRGSLVLHHSLPKFCVIKVNELMVNPCTAYSTLSAINVDKLLRRPEVQNYLDLISAEFDKIKSENKEMTKISQICSEINLYKEALKQLKTLNCENDEDMKSLIVHEEDTFNNKINKLSGELIMLALPLDYENENVIFSVIPGLGGKEAKLFSEELFYAYLNYGKYRNWSVTDIDISKDSDGEFCRAEVIFSGESVFRFLKYEAGIHRVQRVPKTEKYDKMQTSTCKINVVPDLEIKDIVLNPKDLKIELKRSSGPGGQNVNKVETCVRITHIPTGLFAESQRERFQEINKALALKKLKQLLYQQQCEKISSLTKNMKKEQASTVKRSDKIRTYNFMQNRVTDHRINYTIHDIQKYMEGNKLFDELLQQVYVNCQEEDFIKNINRLMEHNNFKKLFEK